jgi:hypothetical protein
VAHSLKLWLDQKNSKRACHHGEIPVKVSRVVQESTMSVIEWPCLGNGCTAIQSPRAPARGPAVHGRAWVCGSSHAGRARRCSEPCATAGARSAHARTCRLRRHRNTHTHTRTHTRARAHTHGVGLRRARPAMTRPHLRRGVVDRHTLPQLPRRASAPRLYAPSRGSSAAWEHTHSRHIPGLAGHRTTLCPPR